MHYKTHGYVPLLSTQPGSCLTAQNWKDASVSAIAYSLQQLLFKPKAEVLRQCPNLSSFLGWSGVVILDARMPVAFRDGHFMLQSPYDGSKSTITAQQLIDLIGHLAADYVIFPSGIQKLVPDIWQQLPEGICPIISTEDRESFPATRKFVIQLNPEQIKSREEYSQYPFITTGISDVISDDKAVQREALFFLSDNPLSDACQGVVYTSKGKVDLKQKESSEQFEVIDSHCTCPVCKQSLTRAYLHHLLEHTPLLCHRFLIQHNVYFIQKDFLKNF